MSEASLSYMKSISKSNHLKPGLFVFKKMSLYLHWELLLFYSFHLQKVNIFNDLNAFRVKDEHNQSTNCRIRSFFSQYNRYEEDKCRE